MIIPKGAWYFSSEVGHYNVLYPVNQATQADCAITVSRVAWTNQRGLTAWSTSTGSVVWCDNNAVKPDNVASNVKSLINLFVVTTAGYYTAIQGSTPIRDRQILDSLAAIIQQLRPGADKYYFTAIVEVDKHSNPTDTSRDELNALISCLEQLADM